ncbi:MAG TPA: acyl-ACP thioesterase domain-containing protein [Candidatus Limnocylindrales bacterium]|nr:acyl-ACP thioesterase domain-containing protein [Candidatus Limnocylindrales bacterium]
MTDAGGSTASYEAAYRVRFDEAGPDGRLRTSGLLRYTQDLAARHSEALGYDRAWYRERSLTWLVRTAEIEIAAPIPYGAEVAGTTRVVGFRRVWSRRESTFRVGSRLAALVRIDWVLLDGGGSPTRIPSEFEVFFTSSAPSAGLQLGRVRLGEPRPEARQRTITVRPQELDPLDHVNNAVYADWLDEAVLAAAGDDGALAVHGLPRRVRLEYALAAEPRETLETLTWWDDGGWSCAVRRGSDSADLLRARLEPMAELIQTPGV